MRIEQKHDRDDCPAYADHSFADQLREIDTLLDELPELVALVYDDLIEAEGVEPDWGRKGMTARQVLGATVAYHVSGVSYEKLAFLLKDSASFQCLCRIPEAEEAPSSSTLQDNISKVTSETWQTIQTILVRYAAAEPSLSPNSRRSPTEGEPSSIKRGVDFSKENGFRPRRKLSRCSRPIPISSSPTRERCSLGTKSC